MEEIYRRDIRWKGPRRANDYSLIGSASLTLEDTTARMLAAAEAGKIVARVQSGDPAIYGALHEQLAVLEAPNPSNQFSRLVLRNDARRCSLILIEWTLQ